MALSLRPYQVQAVDAVFDYWRSEGGNPLVDLATGTGKSLVIAEVIRRLIADYPQMRVLSLVHVKELVKGNADELRKHAPHLQVGINSAGLRERDCHQRILFAGIQSVSHLCGQLGPRDLLIIDEAHLLPKSGIGRYHSLIQEMRLLNSDMRVLGLTATPYRLDSGRLNEGDGAIFDKIVYTYSIAQGVEDGYLSPLVAKSTAQKLDVSGVAKRGGEFVAADLELAVNDEAVTRAACDEIVERAGDCEAWLIFCCGLKHAASVRDALRQRGVSCDMVTGETPNATRDQIVSNFKCGRITALVNVNVLTTGFNVPRVDLIAMLRPTLSTSLYVQMLGRGSRLAPEKTDCLVLDFAGNIRRHGPLDDIIVKPGKVDSGRVKEDTVRAKECPRCQTLVGLRVYECPDCGHQWEAPAEAKHDTKPDTEVVLFTKQREGAWLDVTEQQAFLHHKAGSQPSVRIEYRVGRNVYKQWVCLQHGGFVGAKAQAWWRRHVGEPIDVAFDAAAFNRQEPISQIQVRKNDKYWEVISWKTKRETLEKAS
jgi:DNA repair protein RadD